MSMMDFLTQPMGGPQHPMAQAMGAPPPAFASQMNPMFWAGLGMLADAGHQRGSGAPRAISAAMGGLSMGNAIAAQESAQALEWAKLQATMGQSALQTEKLRMDIESARRKRHNARLAQSVLGVPGTAREMEGPPRPGQESVGSVMEGGSGYLGGELTAPQAGAMLAGLGKEYMPMATDLFARGEPLAPKDRFIRGDDGALWDVSNPSAPRYVPAPGGMGGAGGAGWTPDAIAKEYTLENYTPDSVQAARAARDPRLLVSRGVYDPSNMTSADIRSFRQDFQDNTATAREGAGSVKKMMMALNEPGGITDVASLYGFIKAIDPGSVVREGEVQIVESARGLVNNLKSMLSKAQGRGFLTDTDRQQLAKIGEGLMQHYEESYNSWRNHYNEVVSPVVSAGRVNPAIVYGPRPSFSAPALADRFMAPSPAASADDPAGNARTIMSDQEADRLRYLEEKARGLHSLDTGVTP